MRNLPRDDLDPVVGPTAQRAPVAGRRDAQGLLIGASRRRQEDVVQDGRAAVTGGKTEASTREGQKMTPRGELYAERCHRVRVQRVAAELGADQPPWQP